MNQESPVQTTGLCFFHVLLIDQNAKSAASIAIRHCAPPSRLSRCPLARGSTRRGWPRVDSVLYLIEKIEGVGFFVFVVYVVVNALGVFFSPGLVVVEFMIEQVIVLGFGDVDFFAH
jgi:hypothetical protein